MKVVHVLYGKAKPIVGEIMSGKLSCHKTKYKKYIYMNKCQV